MSLRSLRHLFEPERILWVGPEGEAARWAQIAEANLWDAGFQGPIQALRSTGRAPAEACLETLAGLAPEPRLAVVCLPQADLPALLGELACLQLPRRHPARRRDRRRSARRRGGTRGAGGSTSARAAPDRPGSGRRDRAGAAAQHGLCHGDAAAGRPRFRHPVGFDRDRHARMGGRAEDRLLPHCLRGRACGGGAGRHSGLPRPGHRDPGHPDPSRRHRRRAALHVGCARRRPHQARARSQGRPAARPAGGAPRRHRSAPAPGPGLRRRLHSGWLGPGRFDRGAVRRCRQPGPKRYTPRPRAAQGQARAAHQRSWAGRARGRRTADRRRDAGAADAADPCGDHRCRGRGRLAGELGGSRAGRGRRRLCGGFGGAAADARSGRRAGDPRSGGRHRSGRGGNRGGSDGRSTQAAQLAAPGARGLAGRGRPGSGHGSARPGGDPGLQDARGRGARIRLSRPA